MEMGIPTNTNTNTNTNTTRTIKITTVPYQNGTGTNTASSTGINTALNGSNQAHAHAHAQAQAHAQAIANNQDERLHKFLTRLQHTKPTVPPSLTRRILHKQGVGFSDPLVSTVVSCAADRFLATVLSQALVCRDRRFKGEELARKEKREVERVRKRRRTEHSKIANKKQSLETELEEFVNFKKGQKSPQKQDKKGSSELIKLLETNTFDGIGKKDCLDEEEDHYDKLDTSTSTRTGNNGNTNSDGDGDGDSHKDNEGGNRSYEEDESDEDDDDDDDDDRDILQMRDLVRPLEAWGLSLTGKMGLATEPYIRTLKEKTNENEEDNVGLDGEADAADADEEDDEMAAAVEKMTPSRKRKAGAKGSPATSKNDGNVTLAINIPGKSTAS